MIKTLVHKYLPAMVTLRQSLHQIPELKYEEFKTSTLVSEALKSYGCEVRTGVAKTGIVAMIDSGKPGPTVALRADMDALPIHEETGVVYQSIHPNVMHACGHDGHTATLLLVAQVLQEMKAHFRGKVKLIFQPAEEGGKGSLAMIKDGVLENPKVDAIFGYHNWPGLALGHVGTRVGTILVATGRIEITIQGRVAHTSMPQNAINPVLIGAKYITALETLCQEYSRQGAILNITRFECGEMKSGMTDTVKITGVYYVENETILAQLKADIEHQCQAIIIAGGATFAIDYFAFHTPTINTAAEAKLVLKTAQECLSDAEVIEFAKPQIAAEDFSEYLRLVPGCFFLVGAGENSPPVHTSKFDFPDSIMKNAAIVMCQTALNYLNTKP
ncbi:MAG: M20 family metallopeptidase [Gammaproteobacteria bacterium]|nr:M20 family metallopeptidase [Gammaproteobacteria bacterium]